MTSLQRRRGPSPIGWPTARPWPMPPASESCVRISRAEYAPQTGPWTRWRRPCFRAKTCGPEWRVCSSTARVAFAIRLSFRDANNRHLAAGNLCCSPYRRSLERNACRVVQSCFAFAAPQSVPRGELAHCPSQEGVPMPEYATLLFEVRDHVAHMTLNRPADATAL